MNKTRILLIYSSEIQSQVAVAFLRVAPIGLFFINGYLESKGYQTRVMHIRTTHFGTSLCESEDYRKALSNEIEEYDPHYIGYSFRNLFHWGISKNPDCCI